MNKFQQFIESPRLLVWLGMLVFGYSWLISLCLQTWIIPSLFSQNGATEGLVVLDSIGFDQIAKAKAAEIASVGWSAWELRPHVQAPAGIASVFYVLFGPSPSSVLPFNAAIHAISACVVVLILRNFFSGVPAILGGVLFALNPASLEWVAQIHRDGVFILGNLLFLLGIMNCIRDIELTERMGVKFGLSMFLTSIAGVWLIWVARTYWVQISLVTLVLIAIVTILSTFIRKTVVSRNRIVLWAGMFLCLGVFQMWLIRFHTPYEPVDMPASVAKVSQSNSHADAEDNSGYQFSWSRTSWLPEAIETRFYRIASARRGAISQGGNSLVDADWPLNSVGTMIGYIPRALQLGLLSPFPNLWSGEASTPAMTMARKVVGGVTLFFYVCLVGFAIGLWRMRKNLLLWIMMVTCLTGILVYTLTYPNIGSLMRYRYGFYMLLIGFGIAYWCDLWLRRSSTLNKG